MTENTTAPAAEETEAPAEGAGRTLLMSAVDNLLAEVLTGSAALHELIAIDPFRERYPVTFVLEGKMALHTEFYEPLLLDVGGSVYFDSTMGHAYLSVGSVPLKLLCVCTTPEPALLAGATDPTTATHPVTTTNLNASRKRGRS